MNERIKQCWLTAAREDCGDKWDTQEEFIERFTEVIVKECSKAIETWKKEPFPFDEDLAVQLIHEHFGFEVPPKTIKVIKI